jgi:hypothetical protein
MLLPHNPYRLPQHQRHVCGPSSTCKHWFFYFFFFNISNFWALVLAESYGYSMPLTNFLVNNYSSFHRPVLIYHPTVNFSADDKASNVWTLLVSWDKMCSYYVSTYQSGFVEGFRRWRGYILAPQRIPDIQGSSCVASHCSLSDKSEKNSSKLWHNVCNVFISHSAI